MQNEVDNIIQDQGEKKEQITQYKKFVKDMSTVVKVLVKKATSAINSTKDNENYNTEENESFKALLEQKARLLNVEKKIMQKRQAGFKIPEIKAHPAIKIGYSEDEPTTNDERTTHKILTPLNT